MKDISVLSVLKKVGIALIIFFVIIFLYLWGEPPEARKLIMQSFKGQFRPTVFLNCDVKCEEIEAVWIFSLSHLPYADDQRNGYYIYSNPGKIKKLIDYFCNVKLIEVPKEEVIHNRSPDSDIILLLKNGERNLWITIYNAGDYIKTPGMSASIFKCRKKFFLEGLNNLDLGI